MSVYENNNNKDRDEMLEKTFHLRAIQSFEALINFISQWPAKKGARETHRPYLHNIKIL